MDMRVEQLRAIEVDSGWDADVADRPARARGSYRLHHRLVRADTFQHGVRTHALGQLPDAFNALVSALGHDIRGAELARELLARFVATHRDDPLRAHLLRGQHTQQSDRAVTDHCDRRTWLYVRGIGGEPPGTHDVRERQQARDQIARRNVRRGHECTVRERDAQPRRLRTDDVLFVLTGRLVAGVAVRTRVVRREERPDNELARLNRRQPASDLLDDAAVLVPHGRRFSDRVDAAVRPQVGPADAGRGQTDDGIRRLDDCWRGALLETHVARPVENSSAHD